MWVLNKIFVSSRCNLRSLKIISCKACGLIIEERRCPIDPRIFVDFESFHGEMVKIQAQDLMIIVINEKLKKSLHFPHTLFFTST